MTFLNEFTIYFKKIDSIYSNKSTFYAKNKIKNKIKCKKLRKHFCDFLMFRKNY